MLPRIRPAPPAVVARDRDPETLALLREGSDQGLRNLLDDHGGRVLAALRRVFAQQLDELEFAAALNQAGMRVWQARRTYDPTKLSLGEWLFVIARNCARRIAEARRRLDRPSLDHLVDEVATPIDGFAVASSNGFMQDLLRCIRELPALQRAVLLADVSEGGTVPAHRLAQELGTTTNSIYVSRTHGRKALRVAMAALGHGWINACSPSGDQE